jgi:CRP-like cAMP-binding protein
MGLQGIPVEYEDGAVIFTKGDSAADMYVVRSGAVEIVGWSENGPVTLEMVEEGGMFGEMAIFSPGRRSASAVARGRTVVEVIDTPTFQSYVSDPTVWRICEKLSERCRRATAGALDVHDSIE